MFNVIFLLFTRVIFFTKLFFVSMIVLWKIMSNFTDDSTGDMCLAICSSEEWQKVSKSEREKIGVTVQDDGEFW